MKENSEWKVHSGTFFTYNKIRTFFQFSKSISNPFLQKLFGYLSILVPKEKKVNENKTVKNSVSIDRKKMLKE